jgi:hypothetical protein
MCTAAALRYNGIASGRCVRCCRVPIEELFERGFKMTFSSIVYYGQPGLEADIFQSYMRCSGYPVQLVTTNSLNSSLIVPLAAPIAVIALDKPCEDLIRIVHNLRVQNEGCVKRIFILSDSQSLQVDEPGVEIITRPFRLSEVIKRIQNLKHED